MAVNPSSDIVVDVLKAADPARAETVMQRLSALGVSSGNFTKMLDSASPSTTASLAGLANGARTSTSVPHASAVTDPKTARAEVNFEASILNDFVQEMLPKDAPDVYGTGSAGDIWKSMLADQISRQIAKSGELGIARHLFATHPLPEQVHERHPSSASAGGGADTTQMSANALSMASSADASNGAFLFADRKSS